MSPTCLFDSTGAALLFALNFTSSTPRPVMNRMVADGMLRLVEKEDGRKVVVAKRGSPKQQREALRGLDGAGQAALIAKQLDYLEPAQKDCVIARYKAWKLPCSCRAPCCSGYRKNPAWSQAISRICVSLKEDAELSRIKGRKGLSTPPQMRTALVERFFVPEKLLVIAELAERCGVTPQTVMTHKQPIEKYLYETLRLGISQMDQILNQLGIVGQID